MAKLSAKSAVLTLVDSGSQSRTISGDVEMYTVENAVDTNEVTGMGEAVHNYVPGFKVQSVTFTPYWNSAANTGAFTVISGILGQATASTVTVQPEGTGKTFTLSCMLVGFTVTGTTKDPIKLGSVKLVPMGSSAGSWA